MRYGSQIDDVTTAAINSIVDGQSQDTVEQQLESGDDRPRAYSDENLTGLEMANAIIETYNELSETLLDMKNNEGSLVKAQTNRSWIAAQVISKFCSAIQYIGYGLVYVLTFLIFPIIHIRFVHKPNDELYMDRLNAYLEEKAYKYQNGIKDGEFVSMLKWVGQLFLDISAVMFLYIGFSIVPIIGPLIVIAGLVMTIGDLGTSITNKFIGGGKAQVGKDAMDIVRENIKSLEERVKDLRKYAEQLGRLTNEQVEQLQSCVSRDAGEIYEVYKGLTSAERKQYIKKLRKAELNR